MNNLYLVWIWDGYNDSCAHLEIIFANQQDAVDYASGVCLPHKGVVYVTKEQVGICCTPRYEKLDYVYKRKHYNPTEALWEEISWSLFESGVDKEYLIKHCINNYSPMCVDIDWDLLYKRYKEQYD